MVNINELMVGDWVMYNPNIAEEDEYARYQEPYPSQITNGEDIDSSIEGWFSPINLTTDILSKLGFEVRENNTAVWKKLTEDKSDFEEFILIDLELPSLCRVEKHTKPTASFEGTIKYVHELQHAIKLVNVSLEVKL